MPKTLLVGCSFLSRLQIENSNIKIIGKAGAGNQVLAQLVYHEVAKSDYDQVCVLWSGINRIDIPIGIDLHQVLGHKYHFCTDIDDTVWYFSGGIDMSGNSDQCPREVRQIFTTMYKGATSRYLTDLSLASIVACQKFLESSKIPYKMSFIYDVHKQTQEISWLDQVLGQLDSESKLKNLVDWTRIQTHDTPFEWCQQQNLISDDKFHPTPDGMKKWLLKNFDLDLAKLIDH